jgi:hypothetical protein
MMFLTPNELQQLTGYKKPKLQRQWLVDNGYSFDVRADGRPVVMTEQVSSRQLKRLSHHHNADDEPDFDALLN